MSDLPDLRRGGFFDCDVPEDLRPSFGAGTFANDLASKPVSVDEVLKVVRELHERELGKALQLQRGSGAPFANDIEILESAATLDGDTLNFKFVARQRVAYSHPFIMVKVDFDRRKPPRRHSVNDAANRLLAIDAKKGRVRYRTRRRALERVHKRSDTMKPGSGSEVLRKAAIRIRTRRPNRAARRRALFATK